LSDYSEDRRRPRDVETAVFQYGAAMIFLWLLTGFWQLQVQDPEIYEQRAARNRIKSIPILAPRGTILDRDGRILVDNSPSFKAVLDPGELKLEHLPLISEGLNIPYDKLQTRLRTLRRSGAPGYQRVIIKEGLTPAEVTFLEAHRAELREFELIRSQRRLYLSDGLAAHVVGRVGEISEAELDKEEFALFEAGAEVGKSGIERQYNDALAGKDGSRLVIVDSRSRRVRDLDVVEAKPGRSIRLTIDLDVQAVAELALEGRSGAVVALNPRTGEVLALASSPAYDPNEFVGGIGVSQWRELLNNPDKPLLNRAIQAQLAPGSIFKPVVAYAGLATHVVSPGFQVHCSGGASFYGRFFRCHHWSGHGWVNLEKALVQSCDVYFYNVGKELGVDRIAEFARVAGLGSATGIDLPGEEDGVVPSSTWKARNYRERWFPGETISVAIGQGALTVTPLQAAYSIGGLAMGGVWNQPHLVAWEDLREIRPDFETPEPKRAEVNARHRRAISRGLWGAVNDGGTAARAALADFEICGKTGTAQRVSRAYALEKNNPRLLDDAWFVGYAPCRDPEIVVAALFENGEHGHFSAPIVRDVIKAYYDKQQRLEWSQRAHPPAEAEAPAKAAILRPGGAR